MNMARYEQETIISFNEEEKTPNIVFVWPIWSRHFFRSPANKRTASFSDDHLMDLSYHFSP